MKKNNKGFSLVELIIVIAIMAILAGAIAPALIRYIDKSRKSNDVTSAKAIVTAVETALSDNDDANAFLCGTTIYLNPANGKITSTAPSLPQVALNAAADNYAIEDAEADILETLKKVPTFKYKKSKANLWVVTISDNEIVTCYAAKKTEPTKGVVLAPDGDVNDYKADLDGAVTIGGSSSSSGDASTEATTEDK